MTRFIPGIFGLTLASSRCVSWTHNTSHLYDLQSEARSSPLATEKPSIFCVITLIAGGGGPKKGLFDFECLDMLAPAWVRSVRDILSLSGVIYRDAGGATCRLLPCPP